MKMIAMLPQLLTGLRLASIPFLWWAAYTAHWQVALFIFFIAALTDVFDGYFARKFDVVTKFGAAFDPFVDKLLTISLVTIMYLVPTMLQAPFWFFILMLSKELLLVFGAVYFGFIRREIVISAAVPGKIAGVLQGFLTLYWLFCLSFWSQLLGAFGFSRLFSLIWWGYTIFYGLMILVVVAHGAALLFYGAIFLLQRRR